MSQLVPVVVLATFVIFFGCLLVFLASSFGPKVFQDDAKKESYECGLTPESSGSTRVPIKYYLTAILFILFDIEIIFMYPWALSYNEFLDAGYGLYILGAMGFFLTVFIFGLFWEVKSKALEWE
jgi:NADH-quinone oxidoreductase subunit A